MKVQISDKVNLQVTKEIAEKLGWKDGDELEVETEAPFLIAYHTGAPEVNEMRHLCDQISKNVKNIVGEKSQLDGE